MKDIVNRSSTEASLPADFAAKLVSGIAESRASTVLAGGGKPFLRMLKSGDWVFGPSNEEVQEGSPWVVNVMSVGHGWSCWVEGEGNNKNQLRGEIMVSVAEPKPLRPAPIDGTQYAEQRSFEAKCIGGADDGTEVLHKTASLGGMQAILGLLDVIRAHLSTPEGIAYPCPVVVFGHDQYTHTKWGQIFTPVLEVIGWADMDGQTKPGDDPETSGLEAPEPRPDGTSKAKPRKPPVSPPAARAAEPVSTTQAHVGQRRRPVAR